jgi:hypothetical protein
VTWQQLDLFADDAPRPVYGVTVCPWCGEPVEAVPIADPGDSWQPAVLFGYIAQKAHEREHHPERAA